VRGILGVIAIAIAFVACMHGGPEPEPLWVKHARLENEILIRWQEIRTFRHEAGMDLEPTTTAFMENRGTPPKQVRAVCPNGRDAPKVCHDVCNLSEDICDNMEHICNLADELGKGDDFAQQKCSSAKASCKEARQRCCGCKKDTPS